MAPSTRVAFGVVLTVVAVFFGLSIFEAADGGPAAAGPLATVFAAYATAIVSVVVGLTLRPHGFGKQHMGGGLRRLNDLSKE